MGRFRVFSNKNNTITSSEQSKKKNGIAISKDLCSKKNNIPVGDYTINYCDGTIINYKSYDIDF